jgi:hypothetical protein
MAVAFAIVVVSAPRPLLRLQQLVLPLQLLTIEGISPHQRSGYEVVPIPLQIHAQLQALVDQGGARQAFGGVDEPIEDYIIFGRTERIYIPPLLSGDVREAFRPLLSQFCACELAEYGIVHGIRVYHHGCASSSSHGAGPS